MIIFESLMHKSLHDEDLKVDYMPSCTVPNASLSPSEVLRLYSRGDIAPTGQPLNEDTLDTSPMHTDKLEALTQGMERLTQFNEQLSNVPLQPVSPVPVEAPPESATS